MRSKQILPDEQLKLIMECRQSGQSDYQWCQLHDIKPGTFYNWINRLRKRGIAIPSGSTSSEESQSTFQEVVKIDLVHQNPSMSIPLKAMNNTFTNSDSAIKELPAVEILIGNATVRFFNSTDKTVLETTLMCLGGILYAR